MNNKRLSFTRTFALAAVVLAAGQLAIAGPYSGPTDTSHATDPAIPSDSSLFVEWANAIDATRTYFAPRGSTSISDTDYNFLGDLDESEIINGDSSGFLTVTFSSGICDGSGHDFAVFENGFIFPNDPYLFAELAHVEVSSNGDNFVRFPSISTNTSWEGDYGRAFAGYDSTNIFNLAGKHAGGFGTPFDLADLLCDDLVLSGAVDLNNIQYVRLVDIPGNGSYLDSLGNPILDNWLTAEPTGGFDFRLPVGQGVGVINAVPEPSTVVLLLTAVMMCGGCAARRGRES